MIKWIYTFLNLIFTLIFSENNNKTWENPKSSRERVLPPVSLFYSSMDVVRGMRKEVKTEGEGKEGKKTEKEERGVLSHIQNASHHTKHTEISPQNTQQV